MLDALVRTSLRGSLCSEVSRLPVVLTPYSLIPLMRVPGLLCRIGRGTRPYCVEHSTIRG
jgi:hypothetical protein